jgi:hypothetical protein
MAMKIDFKITFTNFIGFIAFSVGAILMMHKIDGAEAIALAGLGLVATKKVNDMMPKGKQSE